MKQKSSGKGACLIQRIGAFCAVTALILGTTSQAVAAERQVLRGHVPPGAAGLRAVGRVPAGQRLNLAIGLPLRNRDELTRLIAQIYDPTSPNYRHYLSPEDFAQRFGATEADYEAVVAYARAQGLNVTARHGNRLLVDVNGAATEIERAFQLTLNVYNHPKEARTFFAPDREPSLALTVPVSGINGLDNFALPRPANLTKRPAALAGAQPNAGSGASGSYRGGDFRAAYAPGVSLTGAGQVVGLLQFDGYNTSDITTYESQAGLPNVPLQNVLLDGFGGSAGGNNDEVALDIEMSISMAPGLSKVIIYEAGPSGVPNDILSRMATDNQAKQLSSSWTWSPFDTNAEAIFLQFASQGQSFFEASGDSDAYTGAVDTPSDDPYITIVGGTTLTTSGPGGSWVSETAWNWGLVSGKYVGTGGGVSTTYPIPAWQQGISMASNGGSTTMRNLPDVALTGDNVYVVYNNGSAGIFGGTSCAAPLWAGFTALINQQAVANGLNTVGFINPAVYAIGKGGNYAASFHDTTTGNNTSSSSPNNFYAVAGYDLCTGWGTPTGSGLINALAGAPAPSITTNGYAVMVESCPDGVVDPGETVTLNLGLRNIGGANTTNLVATLLSGGGVTSPSGPKTYGVLVASGAAVSNLFSLTATGVCGGSITVTLQLQDGPASLGTVAFSIPLGSFVTSTTLSQNFDGASAPALPAGWTSVVTSGAATSWRTTNGVSDTAPNSAFAPDVAKAGVNDLVSPAVAVASATAQLTFRQNYSFETHTPKHGGLQYYDGGVLEIAVGGGAFSDIVSAGGSFLSGGYNITLASGTGNTLAGRQAWGGNSSGWVTTTVQLPASAAGQTIQLRWGCGTSTTNSGSPAGWYVDSISLQDGFYSCCSPMADLVVTQRISTNLPVAGQNVTYTIGLTNLGPIPAASVVLTDSLPMGVTFVSASPGCANAGGRVTCAVGLLNSGGGTNYTITVMPSAGGPATNVVVVASGTSDPNLANNVASNVTMVDVKPSISTGPTNQVVATGTTVSMTVSAAGAAPLGYQWKFGLTNLPGASGATLLLTNVQFWQGGNYAVVVTNVAGFATSATANLRVLVPPNLTGVRLWPTGAVVSLTTATGLNYTLEYKSTLTATAWTALPPMVLGTGGALQLRDTNAASTQRFYRVLCQ